MGVTTRARPPSSTRSQGRVIALGLAGGALAFAIVASFLTTNRTALVLLIVSPAVAACFLSPKLTLAIGTLVVGIFAVAPRALYEDGQLHLVRLGALLGTGGIAVAAAWWRQCFGVATV